MRIVAIALGVLALLVAAMSYMVWREAVEPVASAPSPLDAGRIQIHTQFEAARKVEAEAEERDWGSASALRGFVKGHQQRIQELTGNPEAAEILAYDRDAVNRLNQRINDLAAQEAAHQAWLESHPAAQESQHPASKPQQ